ncbi:unnamed protein product [Polarella glacialis]|uniref:CENP-V/GFA domain-containing protein n=1 Tax=Polarella glacialis TaxID=89957 RepID=A0A813K507_POLGL|nr:unnamed protein product [Polarella glacialis]CAE8694086.1 unnamed protein product [Polarella glacialis]
MGVLFSTGKLPEPVIGTCDCGKVKIEFSERPLTVFKCHCTNCYKFRSMKVTGTGAEADVQRTELDTHHPTVGFFRNGMAKVVEGEEFVEYTVTRGALPFCLGFKRAHCKECMTPGLIEYPRDTYTWTMMGGACACYIGYMKQPALKTHDFAGHICYDTATDGAKEVNEHDGKPKFGALSGLLKITVALLFRTGPLYHTSDLSGKKRD